MFAAHVLIADSGAGFWAELLFELKTGLLRICVADVPIDQRIIQQRACGRRERDLRKHRGSGLTGRKDVAEKLGLRGVGGVARRKQRIGQRTQGEAVVEETIGAAQERRATAEGRPCEADAWRNIVGIGVNGRQKFKVVAEPGIEGEAWGYLPLVLRVGNRCWGCFAVRRVCRSSA